MERDYLLEAKIAKQVYNRETEWLDTGAGLALYIMANELEDEQDSLLEGRMENGELVQRNGRLCPAWSTNMLDVWELVQYCAAHAHLKFRVMNKQLLAPAYSTPNQIAGSIITKAVIA